MPYTKIEQEDELKIIQDNYINFLSFNQLQKKYHISANRLTKIFSKYGVEIKKNIHKGKYNFNRNFFYQDSAELAYFLGLVSSDGFVQTSANVIGIELKQSDKKILEDISKAMEYNRPILNFERKERGSGYFSKFILENKEIKQLLIDKYGIIPNKSNKNFCFNFYNLNKKYWKDYIRGYFDGDGSIKKTGRYITFQIDCTSLKMLLSIEQALKEYDNDINLSITKREPNFKKEEKIQSKMPIFRLYGYGEMAIKVFKIIYKDANLYLQRKYDRYIEYMK